MPWQSEIYLKDFVLAKVFLQRNILNLKLADQLYFIFGTSPQDY